MPLINFEHFEHLLDIEVILELSIVLENLANSSEELAKLGLEGIFSELWDLLLFLDHVFKLMEV